MEGMKINFKENCKGLSVRFNDKNYDLIFPSAVWKDYPKKIKEVWIDNFAHLSTICSPLVAGMQAVEYNTSLPIFKPLFYNVVLRSIPTATDYYTISTEKVIKWFKDIKYKFKDNKIKKLPCRDKDNRGGSKEERAVVPFSCGKDSLLTFAVCKEIGLRPVAVYINDTIDPPENKIMIRSCRKLHAKQNIDVNFVTNNLEKLNDFRFWGKYEASSGYDPEYWDYAASSHMMTGFCFIALPFSHYYKAKYIIVGNEHDMDWSFKNKDGYTGWSSYDQSSQWMEQQNRMIRLMSANESTVTSLVKPLTSIAIIKTLHSRYPEFSRYEVSCANISAKMAKEWCSKCWECAWLSLLMKAMGVSLKQHAGLKALLSKKHEDFYCLFDEEKLWKTNDFEKSKEFKDQQLLAFYLAYKNGARGYLIEKFKKHFLAEAIQREDELRRKFFGIHKASIPKEIKRDVISIFKEELKELV